MSQRAWNRLASRFEDEVCDITATSGDVLVELVDLVRPNRRQTLVDAGCGIGTFLQRFGRRFGRVYAFDFADRMVRRARDRCRQLKNVTWRAMPLEDAAAALGAVAHLAVCLNVITAPDERLRRRQWESLAGLVRPGGHVLAVVPSLESAQFVAQSQHLPLDSEQADGLLRRTDTPQKHYTRSSLRHCIRRHGLTVRSIRRISYPWDEEGLESVTRQEPWDWVCLAGKPR